MTKIEKKFNSKYEKEINNVYLPDVQYELLQPDVNMHCPTLTVQITPHIVVYLNHCKTNALIDTGSQRCAINSQWVSHKVRFKNAPRLRINTSITTVTNIKEKIRMQILITVKIGTIDCDVPMVVVRN